MNWRHVAVTGAAVSGLFAAQVFAEAAQAEAAQAETPMRELTEEGLPTEAFRKTFVYFQRPHADPVTGENVFFQKDFKVPYRTSPSITAAQFAEYQENGKIPYFLTAHLSRERGKDDGGTAHFVIQDEEGTVLVRESVALKTLDGRVGTTPTGYWGELPRPGKYTLTLWTRTASGVVFGGAERINVAWPPDVPPQVFELTEDGIPTEESQRTFLRFGGAYHHDPANPDDLMYFNMNGFRVPYPIPAARLKGYRESGKVPFVLGMSLWSNRLTRVTHGVTADFAVLDRNGKVVVKDSIAPFVDYEGELPKTGKYTLVVWARTEMAEGIVFGETKEGVYFVLPSADPDEEEEEEEEEDGEWDDRDEGWRTGTLSSPIAPWLHGGLWLCQPFSLKVLGVCLQLAQHGGDFQPIQPQRQEAVVTLADFDCAALIERVKREEREDAREGERNRTNEYLDSYLELLERYRETQKLETTERGYTHLMCAAELGYDDVVADLIAAGVDVNESNRYGQTALENATIQGHADIAKALLAAGARVTSLWSAIHGGNAEIVKALLAAGAKVDSTTLEYAARYGSIDIAIITALLEAGADVNAKDSSGDTALYSAVTWGSIEAVEVLLAAGADPDLQDRNGDTALMSASQGYNAGCREKALMLIAAGANANLQNKDGRTAFMEIARWARTNEVVAMLAAGANTEVADNGGRTALIVTVDDG
ncbi:MAG: ankyrin repeat domain-containing protein, partial [Kiritimatiellaeota bacterium]|nr:ankyrin repeat domain-containing protein [Kiritimatiellota bacterium]